MRVEQGSRGKQPLLRRDDRLQAGPCGIEGLLVDIDQREAQPTAIVGLEPERRLFEVDARPAADADDAEFVLRRRRATSGDDAGDQVHACPHGFDGLLLQEVTIEESAERVVTLAAQPEVGLHLEVARIAARLRTGPPLQIAAHQQVAGYFPKHLTWALIPSTDEAGRRERGEAAVERHVDATL